MSEIRVENIVGETGTDAVKFTKGVNVTGIVTATGMNVGAGISIHDTGIKASNFYGSGAALTGISAGILQVKQVKRTDYQTSSGSWADITGLSITITPTAATTQMMLIPNIST